MVGYPQLFSLVNVNIVLECVLNPRILLVFLARLSGA